MNSGYNLQDYIKSTKKKKEKTIDDLYLEKFGAGNYNPDLAWNDQKTKPLPTWSRQQEDVARLKYDDYLSMQQPYLEALELQSNQLLNASEQAKANAGISQQLVQKYLGNELRAGGINTGGMAESSMVGVGNQYAQNISSIDKAKMLQESDLLNQYKTANLQNQSYLNSKIGEENEKWQNQYMNAFNQEIAEKLENDTLTLQDYEEIKERYAQKGIDDLYMKEIDDLLLKDITTRDYERPREKYGITDTTARYSLDSDKPTSLTKKEQELMPSSKFSNDAKMDAIRKNPEKYENQVVKLYNSTFTKGQLYVVSEGKLWKIDGYSFWGKQKFDEHPDFIEIEKEAKDFISFSKKNKLNQTDTL